MSFFDKNNRHKIFCFLAVLILVAAGQLFWRDSISAAHSRITAAGVNHPEKVYIRQPLHPAQETLAEESKVAHSLFEGISSIDFTIGILPDTQFYSRSHPEIFEKINRWFAANRKQLHLKYIFHLGDVVNDANQPDQWQAADRSMRILDRAMIPYGIISGNHDVGPADDYRQFTHYFGENRYRWNRWYGGSYENNRGHFDLIDAAGKKYLMLAMGWGIDQKEISWMNKILRQYRDRTAILSVHDYLNGSGKRTKQGKLLFDRLVRKNSNVKMVVNGHNYGVARRVDKIDDNRDGKADRQVIQMLSDYQHVDGGGGYIRVLGFDLTHHKVYVRTFSPINGRTHAFKKSDDNFVLDFD